MKRIMPVLTLCALLFALMLVRRRAAAEESLPHRVSWMTHCFRHRGSLVARRFRLELSKLGWIEGKNIAIEYRFAEQKSRSRCLSLRPNWFVLRLI